MADTFVQLNKDDGSDNVKVKLIDEGDGTYSVSTSGGGGVTVSNGSGASAVNIQDGGNSITVDGTVSQTGASSSSVSQVACTTSSATLIASNASRLGATIYNDASSALYVKFGSSASSTSFTVKVLAGGYLEVPFRYTGIITGALASGTGNAYATELS